MRNSFRVFPKIGRRPPPRSLAVALISACVGALLAACGGGSGGGTSAPTTTVSGSVFAASVAGASVTVKDAGGAPVAGPVTTGSGGTYSVTIPDSALSGNLRFEATGGTFTDEATGSNTTAGHLAAFVEAGALAAGSAVHLTPASTVVHDLVAGGMAVQDAKTAFRAAFGFSDNTGVAPRNDNAAGTSNAQKLAALRAVAFSQMTNDMGLSPADQFPLLSKIAADLSDGVLNGMQGGIPLSVGSVPLREDIQNRFGCALAKAVDNASINHTGLLPTQVGTVPFGKVALTPTYRVEYVPGMMAAMQGKTQFRIKVTRLSDNTAVTGLSLALMPMMHMADKTHATPVDPSIVDQGGGFYLCTAYYVMSSTMSGMPMGFWELKVVIGGMGGETVTFHPDVAMPMGDTVLAILRGQADQENTMTGPQARRYYLFRDGLNGTTGNHTFNVFVAAFDSMMNWPAVQVGTTLTPPSPGMPWTVSAVTVEASTDNVVWVGGTNNGAHWTFAGLGGLVSGSQGSVSVRLKVALDNGATVLDEQKTTDGLPPGATNGYQTFKVTAP